MSNSSNDVLPASVPKLDVSGGNWAIFSLRFQTAIQGKGLWGHFDGTVPCPVNSSAQTSSVAVQASGTPATAAATPPLDTHPTPPTIPMTPVPVGTSAEIDTWKRNEGIARALLAQRLPDSTFVVTSTCATVKLMWDAIVRDYTYKSAFSQAHLRREFMTARCPDKGDVRAFLNDLRAKKVELSAVGVNISDDDYQSAIIQSLPRWLASYASNQLSAARLHTSLQHTIDPDVLITLVCDEWEQTRPVGKGGSRQEGDDALAFEAGGKGEKGKEKGKGKGKAKGPCWDCSGDHWKRDCPNKKDKKGGSGNTPTKPNTSVNAVEEEDDCSFMVEELSEGETDSSWIELEERSDGSWTEGEFAKEFEDWSDEEFDIVAEESATEEIINVSAPISTRIEVFDSGATAHISPYRDEFSTFESISPRPLRAANKQAFSAVGKGEVILDLPNGATSSQLHLSEVLYSPEAGYTLVSIGRLNDAGFKTTFANGKCIIRDAGGA